MTLNPKAIEALVRFFVDNRASSYDTPKNNTEMRRLMERFHTAAELAESLSINNATDAAALEVSVRRALTEAK